MPTTGYDPTVPDRKPRLSDDAIQVAILWLESNEGEEAEDLQTVADWLKTELNHRAVKRAAKEQGVPVAFVRQAIERTL